MGRRAKARKTLIAHILERQVKPQRIARELRGQGLNVETRFVSTAEDAEGIQVTCEGCARTARVHGPVPEGMILLCPNCMGPGPG